MEFKAEQHGQYRARKGLKKQHEMQESITSHGLRIVEK